MVSRWSDIFSYYYHIAYYVIYAIKYYSNI
nr:MAG TPA: hypothetical protein [Caudoviricetes sp.]